MTPTATSTSSERLRDDRGFGAVETAIVVPILFIVLMLMVAAARVASANLDVDSAASAAARAASIERSGATAGGAAREAATSTLNENEMNCAGLDIAPDTSGFNSTPGARSSVTVTVTCTVPLADLSLPGAPGSKTITASSTSPIDRFRGRQ